MHVILLKLLTISSKYIVITNYLVANYVSDKIRRPFFFCDFVGRTQGAT